MKKVSLKLSSMFLFFFCIFSVSALEIKLTVYEEELGVGETSVVTLNETSTNEVNVTNAWKYTPSTNTLELYPPESEYDTTSRIRYIEVTGTSSENLTLNILSSVSFGYVKEGNDPDTVPTILSNGPKITITGSKDATLDIMVEGKSGIVLGAGGLVLEKTTLRIANNNWYDLEEKPALITSEVATSIEVKNHGTLDLTNEVGKGISLENSTFKLDRASLYIDAVDSLIEIKSDENPFTLTNVKTYGSYTYGVNNASGYYFLTTNKSTLDLFPDEIDLGEYEIYYKDNNVVGHVKFTNEKGEEITSAVPGEKISFELVLDEGYAYKESDIKLYYWTIDEDYIWTSHDIEVEEGNKFVVPSEEFEFEVEVYSLNLPKLEGLYFDQSYSTLYWDAEPNVDGYEIYRSTSKTSGFKKIDTAKAEDYPSYRDLTAKSKTTYYYKIRAYRTKSGTNSYGEFSNVVTAKYLMEAPYVYVSTEDYDRLSVYMSSRSNVDGFVIERSTDNKNWTKIKTVTTSAKDYFECEYTDKGLALGKKYYYRVKSYAKVNGTTYYSKYSTVSSEKVQLSEPYVDASGATFDSVTLVWEKVNKATKYQITLYKELGNNKTQKLATYSTTKLTYKISNLEAYQDYAVEVKAIYGKYSSTSGYGFTAVPMPKISHTSQGTDVTISWPAIEEASKYYIMWAYADDIYSWSSEPEYGEKTLTNVDAAEGTISVNVKNVPMGSHFAYMVAAEYEHGEEEYTSNMYTKDFKTTVTGTTVTVDKVNYKSVKATWASVDGVEGYILYRSTDNKTWTKVYSGKDLTYTDSVTTGTKYYYMVRTYVKPYGKVIYSKNSASKAITVNVDAPSASVTKTTYNTNTITWNKVAGATGYVIERSTDNKTFKALKTITSAKTVTYTDKSLATGTTYYYRVKAYRTVSKKNKFGAYSGVVSGKPYLNTTTVTGYNDFYSGAKVTFTKVAGAKGYIIERSEDGNTFTKVATVTTTSYVDTKAVAGVEYSYRVRAYIVVNKKNKYSEYSNVVTATKVASTLTVTADVESSTSVKLTMTEVEGATKYYIYRATSKKGEYKLVTKSSSLEYTDTKLTAGTTYYYKVRAYNKDFGDYSSIVSVKLSK